MTVSFKFNTSSINCGFEEKTFCNWQNEVNAKMNWTLGNGSTDPFGQTGPKGGAKNTEFYIYIDSRKNPYGKFKEFE